MDAFSIKTAVKKTMQTSITKKGHHPDGAPAIHHAPVRPPKGAASPSKKAKKGTPAEAEPTVDDPADAQLLCVATGDGLAMYRLTPRGVGGPGGAPRAELQ